MGFCHVFIYLCIIATLICPSYQEKSSSSNRRQRSSSSSKKASGSKPVKQSKFKLDLKMDDSLPPLNYQSAPTRSNHREEAREWFRNSRSSSNAAPTPNWYGFENYVPRKSRSSFSSSSSPSSSVRKSYVIGEGYMNSNNNHDHNNNHNHNHNQVSVRYHRQSEPELDFNLVVPQLEIDAHYRPKVQEQRQVYGNLLEMNKLGNTFTTEKSEPQPYYQPSYAPVRSAPIPVVIKIIPLKLSSSYLREALKTMPFIPLPMSLFNVLRNSISYTGMDTSMEDMKSNRGSHRNEYTIRYDDTMPDMVLTRDPESLPRPSSHVATPLDVPPSTTVTKGNLGVTYLDDEGSQFEYDNRFRKRTTNPT